MKTAESGFGGTSGPIIDNVATRGDAIERLHSEFILTVLPEYDRIWSAYIGNDGNDRMLPIRGLRDDLEDVRKKVSQYNYTSLESIVCMRRLGEKYSSHQAKVPGVDSPEYLDFLNDLLAFHANIGRIQDMVEKTTYLLKTGDTWKRFLNGAFKKRNVVLHGHKVPIAIVHGVIEIPPIAESDPHRSWHDEKNWGDVPVVAFNFFSDYMPKVTTDIARGMNNFLGMAYGRIAEKFGTKKIIFPSDNPFAHSGRSSTHGNSGSGAYTLIPNEESCQKPNPSVSGQAFIGEARPIRS